MFNSDLMRNAKGHFIKGHKYLGEGKGWFPKGIIPWCKGKKICTNTGRTHFKKGHVSPPGLNKGRIPWNWKGGVDIVNRRIRQSEEYSAWRISVWQRDYWTCKNCGHKGKDIVAHHIKSFSKYPKVRFDVENGVTLCRSCHKRVHSEIGFNTRFKKRIR